MLKSVIAATAALAIAGPSIVYAQQHFRGSDNDGDTRARFEHRHRPSAADMAAFTDARIAALKAGLELTPDQAKNWPPFEQALRDMAQLRIQRAQAREARANQGQTATSPFDRLSRRADNMVKASAALKRIAETGAPLYQSLDDTQKARFKKLARILRPHHHRFAFNQHSQHGWRQGEGYGNGGWRPWGQDGQQFGQNDGQGGRMHHTMRGDQGSQL
jgi:zinc resistance-associated protein